jgi:copper homeostasis protein
MKEDILCCKELGCSGIVSGVLNANQTIDVQRTQELIELSNPLSFTFHRAFDWIPNPKEGIKQLSEIGVHRVLTSGQTASAANGMERLKKWKKLTNVKILPGGGINTQNARLFLEAGFKEIHLSATEFIKTMDTPKILMNSPKHFDETQIAISNTETIQQILSILRND